MKRRRGFKVEPGKYVRFHAHIKPSTRKVIEELAGEYGLGAGLDRLAKIYRKKIAPIAQQSIDSPA